MPRSVKAGFISAVSLVALLFVASCFPSRSENYPSFSASAENKRSSKWPAVREKHLRDHPECIACGGKEKLNVHHIVSFSVRPDLELSPENLCTLCTKNKFGMNDHFVFGHNGNWKCRNANVLRDAARFREMLDARICNETHAD